MPQYTILTVRFCAFHTKTQGKQKRPRILRFAVLTNGEKCAIMRTSSITEEKPMLYRQEAPYLRYEQIPVSSTTYNYSPCHATQPTELKKHGILWFSIPHNHLAVEILRIVQGEVWVSVNGTPHALYAGDLVFLNPFDVHATYVTAPDTMNEFHVINFDLSLLKNGAVPDFDAYLESIEENVRKFQSLILHDDPHAAELNEEIRNIHAVYAERSAPAGFMRILASLLDLLATLEQDGFVSSGNGEKMSKSRGNVVNPDDIVQDYGADTLRTYEMFIGAFDLSASWSEEGVKGCRRFLERVWKLQDILTDEEDYSADLETKMHQTIKKVSSDFENLKYNTAIAAMMSLINEFYKKNAITRGEYKTLLTLLNPVAPHITEELWQTAGFEGRLYQAAWPEFEEEKTVESVVEIGVQVNGKMRVTINVSKDETKENVINMAKEALGDKLTGNIVKEIYVPGRIVNIVVK